MLMKSLHKICLFYACNSKNRRLRYCSFTCEFLYAITHNSETKRQKRNPERSIDSLSVNINKKNVCMHCLDGIRNGFELTLNIKCRETKTTTPTAHTIYIRKKRPYLLGMNILQRDILTWKFKLSQLISS